MYRRCNRETVLSTRHRRAQLFLHASLRGGTTKQPLTIQSGPANRGLLRTRNDARK